jgi:hypothetical protein
MVDASSMCFKTTHTHLAIYHNGGNTYDPRSMTKYQLDHFKSKVRRQFEPLIEDQELLVKQLKARATDVAVAKLSTKIGSDRIIKAFAELNKN